MSTPRVRDGRPAAGAAGRSRCPAGGPAMPDSASSTTRLASAAVMSAWSYGGETSTTSTPTTGSSRQTRRTASSSSRAVRPPGSGVPVPGACPGSRDVDVDREEHAVAVVDRDRERLVQAGVEAARADLGHLEGAHPLLGHPVQRLGPRPVAAQPDLQEPVAARRAGLDQPAHRLAVAVERAELDVAGVGVRVEVHDRHPAVAVLAGDPGDVGQGDRVVAAEHDRDRAGSWRPRATASVSAASDRSMSPGGISTSPASSTRRSRSGVDPQREVRPGAVVRRGSRSTGSPAGRTGCPAGARCRRRTARPTTTTSAPANVAGSPRSHRSTPRKVMSGPNIAP